MKYQVPQFIEVEDKIFGPFTFKQFVYMVGGAGICFIFYRLLPFIIAILFIVPTASLSLMLAFYMPNKRPFIETMESAFNFVFSSKLYIWKKEEKKIDPKKVDIAQMTKSSVSIPKLSESKLKDLTWSLDINETIYSKEDGKLGSRKSDITRKPF
jgi:hypothetical protein